MVGDQECDGRPHSVWAWSRLYHRTSGEKVKVVVIKQPSWGLKRKEIIIHKQEGIGL